MTEEQNANGIQNDKGDEMTEAQKTRIDATKLSFDVFGSKKDAYEILRNSPEIFDHDEAFSIARSIELV